MTADQVDRFSLTCRRLTCELHDGPQDRFLFCLDAQRPEQRTVCVILDRSDSYQTADQDLEKLRKAVARWPFDWRVEFYQLSHAGCLAAETIAEFSDTNQSKAQRRELTGGLIPTPQRGSFLRPCLEAISRARSGETASVGLVVIVLGDGDFTDFIDPPLSDGMEFVVISRELTSGIHADRRVIQWGTTELASFVGKYETALSGDLPLSVQGAPNDARLFNIDTEEIQPWPLEGARVNLQSKAATFIVDCDPELAIKLNWSIQIAGKTLNLPAPIMEEPLQDTRLAEIVASALATVPENRSLDILFESRLGDGQHIMAQAFFTVAENAAKNREFWKDAGVSQHFEELVSSSEDRTKTGSLGGILVIVARKDALSKPEELVIMGLHRSEKVLMGCGDQIGCFTVEEQIQVGFQQDCRRWSITVGTGNATELGLSSQVIELPLEHASQDVLVLYSGRM